MQNNFKYQLSLPTTAFQENATASVDELVAEFHKLHSEYALLSRYSHELFCFVDRYGFLSRLNTAWMQLLGWTEDELRSRPLIDFVHPQERALVIKTLSYPMPGESTINFECRLRCSDGTYKWCEWSCVYVRERSAHFCIARDISEREQAVEMVRQTREELESRLQKKNIETEQIRKVLHTREEMLAQLERSWHEAFEASPIPQVLFTLTGSIQQCNNAFLSLFGFKASEEIKKHSLSDLYCHQDHFEQHITQLHIQKSIGPFVVAMRRCNNEPLFLQFNAYHYKRQNENDFVIHGYFLDFTRQKQLESYLTQKQRTEVLGTIARGIAHDFNNILGIIMGYLGILEKSDLSAEKHRATVETIVKVIERGADLTKQILTFSQKSEEVLKQVDVNTEIEHLTKLMKATFPKRIQILLQLGQNLPPILFREGQLHQALLNLCVNARDAILAKNSEGKEDAIVLRSYSASEEDIAQFVLRGTSSPYICIEVQDSGIGIEETTLAKIFDPFFTTKAPGQGTGLGLAVVDLIVKNHNGFMDVKSVPGQGTTFRLLFPAAGESPSFQASEDTREPIKESGGTETLLFAEDEIALALAIKQHLESHGYTVLLARDGTEAVQLYSAYQNEIALAVLDVDLPILDGTKVLQKIRRMKPEQKVILTSGYLDLSEHARFQEIGKIEYLQKPYQPEELLKKIRQTLDMLDSHRFVEGA